MKKGNKCLTLTQRRILEALLKENIHKKQIAKQLGCCLATVYNEIKRGTCEQRQKCYDAYGDFKGYKNYTIYSADIAEEKYRANLTSHGPALKIGNDYEFVREIENRVINGKISACAALGEIKRNGLCNTVISKTTLYRYIRLGYIFTQLTMQYVNLKPRRNQKVTVKHAPRGTSIEERPLEILERLIFGHWEMDCVIGKKHTKDTLLTLTERMTRYEIILRMPDHKASTVVQFINKLERRLGKRFSKIFKSITVDNGVEFSDFEGLEKSIYGGRRTSVYYCHPYSSYERGTNERLNREIRRLLPKGTDFTKYTDKQISQVEKWINNYPREIFDYATSSELFELQLQSVQ